MYKCAAMDRSVHSQSTSAAPDSSQTTWTPEEFVPPKLVNLQLNETEVELHEDFQKLLNKPDRKVGLNEAEKLVGEVFPELFDKSLLRQGCDDLVIVPEPLYFHQESLHKQACAFAKENNDFKNGLLIVDYFEQSTLRKLVQKKLAQNNGSKPLFKCLHVDLKQRKFTLIVLLKEFKERTDKKSAVREIADVFREQACAVREILKLVAESCQFDIALLVSQSAHTAIGKFNLDQKLREIVITGQDTSMQKLSNSIYYATENAKGNKRNWSALKLLNAKSEFRDHLNQLSERHFKAIVSFFVLTSPRFYLYGIAGSNSRKQLANETLNCDIANPTQTTQLIKRDYLSNYATKLEVYPRLDESKVNFLGKDEKDGRLNLLHKKSAEFRIEFRDFLEFIRSSFDSSADKKATGILLHSFDNKKTNSIFKQNFIDCFECDWIWFTQNRIMCVELGETKNPESPKSSFMNKFEQITQKSGPKFLIVVASIWLQYRKHTEPEFQVTKESLALCYEFLEKYVMFAIFITNTNKQSVSGALKSVKTDKVNDWQLLRQTKLILKEDNNYKIFGVTKNSNQIQLTETESASSLLHCKAENENDRSSFCYIMSVLGIEFWSVGLKSPPTISERADLEDYQECVEGVKGRQLSPDEIEEMNLHVRCDVLPSMQQRLILDRNPRYLCLNGEPGVGELVLNQISFFLSYKSTCVAMI